MGDSMGKQAPEVIWVHDNLSCPPQRVTDQAAKVGGVLEEKHLLREKS